MGSHTTSAAQQVSMSTKQQQIASSQVVVALKFVTAAHTEYSITRISEINQEMSEMAGQLDALVRQFKLVGATPDA